MLGNICHDAAGMMVNIWLQTFGFIVLCHTCGVIALCHSCGFIVLCYSCEKSELFPKMWM